MDLWNRIVGCNPNRRTLVLLALFLVAAATLILFGWVLSEIDRVLGG